MTQLPDQLSAVRQAQFEAQLDFFSTFTTSALDSASQFAALNVRASRASVEQAAGAFRQLLEVRDPRDLFSLGSAAQGQWQALFSYGRELAGLAAGVRTLPAPLPLPLPLLAARTANVPTSYTQVIEQAAIAADAATTITGEIAAAAVDIGAAHAEAAIESGTVARVDGVPEAAQPAAPIDTQAAQFEAAVEAAIADDVPPAEPTALAKALNEVSPKPASVEHPLASTVPMEAAEAKLELPPLARAPKASRSSRRK